MTTLLTISIPDGNLAAQTFKAEGIATMRQIGERVSPGYQRPFVAHVHEGMWLIRSTNTDPKQFTAYREHAQDGTYLTQYLHRRKERVADPDAIYADSLAILRQPVPGMDDSLVIPIWLGLASRKYFSTLPGAMIAPLWLTSVRGAITNDNPTGRWTFSKSSPHLLSEATFYETPGLLRSFPNGFLRARFSVTTWTNIGDLSLPLEWHVDYLQPGRGKISTKAEPGKPSPQFDREDVVPIAQARMVVTNYQIGVRLDRYQVIPIGAMTVRDERFSEADPPTAIVAYSLRDAVFPAIDNPAALQAYKMRSLQDRRGRERPRD